MPRSVPYALKASTALTRIVVATALASSKAVKDRALMTVLKQTLRRPVVMRLAIALKSARPVSTMAMIYRVSAAMLAIRIVDSASVIDLGQVMEDRVIGLGNASCTILVMLK